MLILNLLTIDKFPSLVPKNKYTIAPPKILPIAPSRSVFFSPLRFAEPGEGVEEAHPAQLHRLTVLLGVRRVVEEVPVAGIRKDGVGRGVSQ